VLEGLKDPLRHLVRNAVDHGASRAAAAPRGRQAGGTRAWWVRPCCAGPRRGDRAPNDGRGINLDALRQQARKKGLPDMPDERELARLIFLPGSPPSAHQGTSRPRASG